MLVAVPTQSIFAPAGMPVPVIGAYRSAPVPVAPFSKVKIVPEQVICPLPAVQVHPVIVRVGVSMNATCFPSSDSVGDVITVVPFVL